MRIRVYPQYGAAGYGGYGGYGVRRYRSYGGYGGYGGQWGGPRIAIRPVGGWRGAWGAPVSPRAMAAQERQAERFAQRSVRGIQRAMRQAEARLAQPLPLPFGYGMNAAMMPGFGAAMLPGFGAYGVTMPGLAAYGFAMPGYAAPYAAYTGAFGGAAYC